MLSSIRFDDQFVAVAGEVGKILTKRDLPAEAGFGEG
jgi:hypothetical protein